METKIPEIVAREILFSYAGSNNHLLELKRKALQLKNYSLSRTQADYIIKYEKVIPKVARKWVKVFASFSEKIREDRLLPNAPEQIWVEKLLCETDKAYHIWGIIKIMIHLFYPTTCFS